MAVCSGQLSSCLDLLSIFKGIHSTEEAGSRNLLWCQSRSSYCCAEWQELALAAVQGGRPAAGLSCVQAYPQDRPAMTGACSKEHSETDAHLDECRLKHGGLVLPCDSLLGYQPVHSVSLGSRRRE